MNGKWCLGALLVTIFVGAAPSAYAQVDTAFTYQGQLKQNGVPVTGVVDFEFELWSADIGGDPVGSPVIRLDEPVHDGLFTVLLDFGPAGNYANPLWMQISVDGIPLSPRQPLTPAPSALYAAEALQSSEVPWSGLTDVPVGFADDLDDDVLASLGCADGQIAKWNNTAGQWECADDETGVASTGTANYLSKFIDSETLGNSVLYESGGKVGVGTTQPEGILHSTVQSYTCTPLFERVNLSSNQLWSTLRLRATKNSEMGDGFGVGLAFQIEDDPNVGEAEVGFIGARRAGADDTADLVFRTYSGGSGAESMRITAEGNVGIGSVSPAARLSIHSLPAEDGVAAISLGEQDTPAFTLESWFAGTGGTGNSLALTTAWSANPMTWRGDGRVGIGTTDPNDMVNGTLTVAGIVNSSTGGFRLPDGTVIDDAGDLGGAGGLALPYVDSGNAPYGPVFSVTNTALSGTGVYGEAGATSTNSATGVHGSASSNLGDCYGVYGEASSTAGIAYGGYFVGQGYFSDKVGFGTTEPEGILHSKVTSYSATPFFERTGLGSDGVWSAMRLRATKSTNMDDGFGVGLAFQIEDDEVAAEAGFIGARRAGADDSADLVFHTYLEGSGAESMRITADGKVGIGTSTPASMLHVNGTTTTDVLTITGADLAEKFPVSDPVKPGVVVEIDPDNPGQLRVARGAYNRRVAGVVSGANGLPAGAILGNLPDHADAPPIALNGRVWVWCDASNGSIEPGDLLTTSDTAGHAMKVGNITQAQGAILGKAMSSLDDGTGLVLVLIQPQ